MAVSKARSSRNMKNCVMLFEKAEGREIIVFDAETTGVKKDIDHIVELSGIKCVIKDKKAVLVEEFDIFIKPPFYMEKKVIDVHGITNEFLEDKPSERELFEDIRNFFGSYPILIGHNVAFDIGMMEEMYKRCGDTFKYEIALDTLEMARDVVPKGESENYTLSAITQAYGLDDGIEFHKSIDDVRATLRILNVFYHEYSKKLSQMALFNKEKVYINYMYFWNGFNKDQRGLYLNTNLGKIYLSTVQKCWCSSEVNLDKINIDELEAEVIRRTGLNFTELGKLTEKKWKEMQSNKE